MHAPEETGTPSDAAAKLATELLSAVDRRDEAAVELILTHGSDPNATYSSEENRSDGEIVKEERPCAFAVLSSPEILRLLLEHGANSNAEEISTVVDSSETRTPLLYEACARRELKAVELLLQHGANPNAEYSLIAAAAGRRNLASS